MCQTNGYNNGSGRVCHLIKTLYRLKQLHHEQNTEFNGKMKTTVWIDNLLLFANTDQVMVKMKSDIQAKWETTDMKEPSKIDSIKINYYLGETSISQMKSIESILKKQGLTNTNPVKMPLNLNIKIVPNPDRNQGNHRNMFMQLLGELQYLVTATRPNIAFAVNYLASYVANPSLQHQTTLK
jgi:hypothetical protein